MWAINITINKLYVKITSLTCFLYCRKSKPIDTHTMFKDSQDKSVFEANASLFKKKLLNNL